MKPTFQNEVQLAGWSESHNSGAKVTFWLPTSEDLEPFRGLTSRKGNTAGHRFAMVLVEIGDDDQPVQPVQAAVQPPRVSNSLASKMHRDGYFNNPRLWEAMERAEYYTQFDHKEHVEGLPCCFPEAHHQGDIVLHHCRTSANSGTGIKPPHWYGIPLCHKHHALVHSGKLSREQQHDLLQRAVGITADQVKAALKEAMGLSSLSEITPEALTEFEEHIGL